jgi:predicted  nucleic acid-binding Zn-ribbon protein
MKKRISDQVKLLLRLHKAETDGNGSHRGRTVEEVFSNLDPSLVKRYLKLKRRKGTGVAILRDGVCSGCNMSYPDTHEMLRYENFVHSCEFCSRLLVVNGSTA